MSILSLSSTTRPPSWLPRPYQGSFVDHTNVGLVSQHSDLSSTAISFRSNLSLPNVRRSAIISRTAERLHLVQRREYEAGRASRIAECYREKLLDVQRKQTGLQDWCQALVLANSALDPDLANTDTPSRSAEPRSKSLTRTRILKSEPIRTDSSYIASEADLTALFLDAANRDCGIHTHTPNHPLYNPWVSSTHHADAPSRPIEELPMVVRSFTKKVPDETHHVPEQSPKVPEQTHHDPKQSPKVPEETHHDPEQSPKVPEQMHHVPEQSPKVPDQTPDVTRVAQIGPSDVNSGILERLGHIFPFHSSNILADALVEASGNELGAIAVLLKSTVRDPAASNRLRRSATFTSVQASRFRERNAFHLPFPINDSMGRIKAKLRWKRIKALFQRNP